MADIVITSGASGKTFTIRTFDSYSFDLDMPVTVFKLPEQDGNKAQLIKIEGNFKSLTLSWVLNDNGEDVSESDDIVTSEDQKYYLETYFESKSLADTPDTVSTTNTRFPQTRTGKFVKILTSLESSDPIHYRGTITLYEGETISSAEDNDEEDDG